MLDLVVIYKVRFKIKGCNCNKYFASFKILDYEGITIQRIMELRYDKYLHMASAQILPLRFGLDSEEANKG
jgi:hypothetical protein